MSPPRGAARRLAARRARRLCLGGALVAMASGAACGAHPASTAAPTAASSPAVVMTTPTPMAAVTMLAPVGAGAPAVASVVPSGRAPAGQVEVVAAHPVVASALEGALLASQRKLFADGRPVGQALGGVLREGQAVEVTTTLEAGCYAAVGLSPSLSLLGLELSGEGATPLSVRSASGVASLGEGACVRLAAGEARLRLTALGGAGPGGGAALRPLNARHHASPRTSPHEAQRLRRHAKAGKLGPFARVEGALFSLGPLLDTVK